MVNIISKIMEVFLKNKQICSVLLLSFISYSSSQGRDLDEDEVLFYENELGFEGDYHYRIELANGVYQEQEGIVKDENLQVQGFYEQISPEGLFTFVNYTSDKNGFRATFRIENEITESQPKIITETQSRILPKSQARIASAAIGSLVGGGLG